MNPGDTILLDDTHPGRIARIVGTNAYVHLKSGTQCMFPLTRLTPAPIEEST